MNTFLIQNLSQKLSSNPENMVDNLLLICNNYYQKPAHSLMDLKMRNTKIKGDIFESFCLLYLKYCYGLPEVWLLNQVPNEILQHLNLQRKDYGIDLIARDSENRYYAIQAKFKNRTQSNKKITLGWKQLSTFYALCQRTGPFHQYIVMTTADYINRQGKKTSKDISIGYHKLTKITHFQWLEMLQLPKKQSTQVLSTDQLTREEVRAKRLLFYTNNSFTNNLVTMNSLSLDSSTGPPK